MDNMNGMTKVLVKTGIIACWLFFILEIVLDIWFGSKFPGYDWTKQSLSYLGQSGSPIEHWVFIWGIAFTALVSLFALAFYQVYKPGNWALTATILLVIYALGEGLGSGSFPIDPPGTLPTLDGKLHNIFSPIGDAGLVLFPFALMLMFPARENPKLHIYLWSVFGMGILMVSFFLVAKYDQPDNFILRYKGVWQRVYLLNYHFMLVVTSFKMLLHPLNISYRST
jgi:hypothetical protein